ncbi:MAG: metalloregulator ArsR/SmtB family transcription factor [Pseudomonadota bacterium]
MANSPPTTRSLSETEAVLKAVGELTRLRLLHLCAHGEHSVGDLVDILGQSQPRVSRHLKILCDAGLLERFRDGHFVYFRMPLSGAGAALAKQFVAMTDQNDQMRVDDHQRMLSLLEEAQSTTADPAFRQLNRLVLDQFISHPVGDLLDIGVGSGAILQLLAGRANHAVGIDIDANARRNTRRAFAAHTLANCTIRDGDMNDLRFSDDSFDTVVLDEILLSSDNPSQTIDEAVRVLRPSGRLLLIEQCAEAEQQTVATRMAALCAEAGLRCGVIRQCFYHDTKFLVTSAESSQPKRKRA